MRTVCLHSVNRTALLRCRPKRAGRAEKSISGAPGSECQTPKPLKVQVLQESQRRVEEGKYLSFTGLFLEIHTKLRHPQTAIFRAAKTCARRA